MSKIGKLEKIDIKDVWLKEDRDFTVWLSQNLDTLSDELGFNLYLKGIEQNAGNFKVDIVAEDDENNKVIIENQYDKSDHDHLGKILTYSRMLEAKTMVWLCEKPRDEHIDTINWLNEITPEDVSFYLVKLEACKIGDSKPAAKFTIICEPSIDRKQLGKLKKSESEQDLKYQDFWGKVITEFNKNKIDLIGREPWTRNYYQIATGINGIHFEWLLVKQREPKGFLVALHFETNDLNLNRSLCDYFSKQKDELQKNFTEKINFSREWTSKSSEICIANENLELDDENVKWGVKIMLKFYDIFKPLLDKYFQENKN